MKLKTRMLFATTATVLVVLGVSGLLSYRQTATFLTNHEVLMQHETDHSALLESLRVDKQTLFAQLAWLHVLHAGAVVLALVIVLSLLWNRLVLSRLQVLLRHINWMSRGTWTIAIPVRSDDEIGELTRAFNQLSEQLFESVQQGEGASKLAGMALLGQGLVREVVVASDHLRATAAMLRLVKERDEAVLDPIMRNLEAVIGALERVPLKFQEDFDRQFRQHALQHRANPDSLEDHDLTSESRLAGTV